MLLNVALISNFPRGICMATVKRVFVVMVTLVVGFYVGTKVRATPTPSPSFPKFNSVVIKGSKVAATQNATLGQALVADGTGKTEWANVKGTDLNSGAASNGMALLADGNGKANWGAIPANAAPLPKVRVVDNSGNAASYSAGAALAFPTVDFDLGQSNGKSGMVGADNTTLTVQDAGVYLITTNFPTESSASPVIVINGKTQVVGVSSPFFDNGGNVDYPNSATAIVNCTQGTKIQVLFGSSGGRIVPNVSAIELVVTKLP